MSGGETEDGSVAGRTHLLESWVAGDAGAKAELLAKFRPRVHAWIREQLGDRLRRHMGDSEDVLQDVSRRIMEWIPPHPFVSEEQFLAAMRRVTGNVINDWVDYIEARKRSPNLLVEVDDASQAWGARDEPDTPSAVACGHEDAAQVRLAMQFLPDEDRRVIQLREWEKFSWEDIGAVFDLKPDAARMKHNRAVAKLVSFLIRIRGGELDALLEEH